MEVDPFPAGDFDGWASTYDKNVLDEEHFPFIGYQRVLDTVVRLAGPHAGMRVLDLGTGTGNLAAAFAAQGCKVWATDYSSQMLALARRKLPQVQLIQADVRSGWPAEITGPFERIVSAYVFHHFELPEKVRLCAIFASQLAPQGKLIFADVAFVNQASLETIRQQAGEHWDEEPYWLADDALQALGSAGLHAVFHPVSVCAGVFMMEKI